MQEQNFSSLIDFTERAQKNRKYADNTASGFRAALKLFEAELNEDEKQSLEVFEKNFDRIYQNVCSKNEKNFNASSLETYSRRVQRVLSDYRKYGLDTSKLANWNPPVRKRATQSKAGLEKDNKVVEENVQTTGLSTQDYSEQSFRLDIPLRDNEKTLIIVPKNITSQEVKMIKGLLDTIMVKKE